jgi:transposase
VFPEKPITRKHVPKSERNAQIIAAYAQGKTLEDIAILFGISIARVHQILIRWAPEQTKTQQEADK